MQFFTKIHCIVLKFILKKKKKGKIKGKMLRKKYCNEAVRTKKYVKNKNLIYIRVRFVYITLRNKIIILI